MKLLTTDNCQLPTGVVQQRLPPYQSFLEERDEILRHKWIESEKAGHDIGFEAALFDWVTNYRPLWKERKG